MSFLQVFKQWKSTTASDVYWVKCSKVQEHKQRGQYQQRYGPTECSHVTSINVNTSAGSIAMSGGCYTMDREPVKTSHGLIFDIVNQSAEVFLGKMLG